MKDYTTFSALEKQISKQYDEIFRELTIDSKGQEPSNKYGSFSRDTHKALKYEIQHMPKEEVETLPSDLKAWIKSIKKSNDTNLVHETSSILKLMEASEKNNINS